MTRPVVFFLVAAFLLAIVFGWQYLSEKALVEKMGAICEQEYNRTYLYHTSESFYCVRYLPRSTLDLPEVDMVEVRYSK